MFLYDIFKVIYSPVKAFREVLANPRFTGPVLIVIISIGLTFGTNYVSASKHYIEVINPTAPRFLWTNTTDLPTYGWATNASAGTISTVSNGNSSLLAGNYSVRADASNASEVWLRATNIGSINCSDPGGFRAFYYKLNYNAVNQSNIPLNVSSAVLRMFSFNNESRFFEFNLLSAPAYLNKSGEWVDTNASLSGWNNVGDANWANVTGFEFRLRFHDKGQLSLSLNDLYFGGKYELLYNVLGFTDWIAVTVIGSSFDIFLRWIIFAALLWLTTKVFHPEGSPFKIMLVIVGYAFAIMFVYLPIDIISTTQLNPLYFPNRVIYPVTGHEMAASPTLTDNIYNAWSPTIPYNVFIGIWYASHIWTIGLFAAALAIQQKFSYKKAILVAIIAYIMGLVIRAIIPF